MERSQQALGRAQFRAKGKWYLAQEVDSLLEELSVCLEEDRQDWEIQEKKLREERDSLLQEKDRLAQELQEARARLAQWEEASQEARQRRVCQELERERDSLIGDIKALRRFRESFRQAVEEDAQSLLRRAFLPAAGGMGTTGWRDGGTPWIGNGCRAASRDF